MGLNKKVGFSIVLLLTIFFVIGVVSANTISSSTIVFEGALTNNGDGSYTGTIHAAQDFDVYAKEGSIVQSSASSINEEPVGSDHDAYPNWNPDVPDAYDNGDSYGGPYYALHLDGSTNSWELWYVSPPGSFTKVYDPMSGNIDWSEGYATETNQNWAETWTWGSENIDLEYPGFQVGIEDIGEGNYRVTMIPAPNTNPVITKVYTDPAYPTTDVDSQSVEVHANVSDSDGIDYTTLIYQIGDNNVENTDFSSPLLGGYAVIPNPIPANGVLVKYRIKTADNLGNINYYPSSSKWETFYYDGSNPIVDVGGAPSQYLVDPSGVNAEVVCEDPYSGCDISSYRLYVSSSPIADCSSISYSSYDPSPQTIATHSYVCAAAKDNAGHTGFSPSAVEFTVFNTIQDAIDAAPAGTTINVTAGTYNEALIINKGVILMGDPGDSTAGPGVNAPLLDGQSILNDAITIQSGVSDVTISGFEIANYIGSSSGVGNAIQAWNSGTSNIEISDNYMHNLEWNGVLVGNDGAIGNHNNWIIRNNILENYVAYGLELTNARDSVIENNVVTASNSWTGILVVARRSEKNITIQNNEISGALDSGADGRAAMYILAGDKNDNLNYPINPNLNDIKIKNNQITTTGAKPHIRFNEVGGTITNVLVNNNVLYSLTSNIVTQINAIDNWWGTNIGSVIATLISGNVDYTPWAYALGLYDHILPITVINSPAESSWHNNNFDLSVGDSDAGEAGLQLCEYQVKVGGVGNWNTITRDWTIRTCDDLVPITVGPSGDCNLEGENMCKVNVRALDNSGNSNWELPWNDRMFSIDFTPPTVVITSNSSTDKMDYFVIKANVSDATSGIKDVKLTLRYLNGSIVSGLENVAMTNGTSGYEYRMRMWELEAGDYTIEITAEDNAGNSFTTTPQAFEILSNVAPSRITTLNGQVPVETGGTVSFRFNVTVRGDGNIKFGMDDIAGLTPSVFNARISKDGINYFDVGDSSFNGAEVLTLTDTDPDTLNIQGSFVLYLDIPEDMVPGTYPIHYYIDVA